MGDSIEYKTEKGQTKRTIHIRYQYLKIFHIMSAPSLRSDKSVNIIKMQGKLKGTSLKGLA